MFLKQVENKNSELIDAAFCLHESGEILPDSFIVDIDSLLYNARLILEESQRYGINLYFMLKQLGRNPYIAKELISLGYSGVVVVDFKEALIMMENNIPIGNVGHLVQVPKNMMEQLILYKPEMITVYSLEKIKQINDIAIKYGLKQKIMIRISTEITAMHEGGFTLDEIPKLIEETRNFFGISISGITSFPCFKYDLTTKKVNPTSNVFTLKKAKEIFGNYGVHISQINFPSVTCCSTIKEISKYGGTHGEPGHGFSGTTPLHSNNNSEVEIPCVVYLSEISHNFNGRSFCFGGGYYKNSNIKSVLVGKTLDSSLEYEVVEQGVDMMSKNRTNRGRIYAM